MALARLLLVEDEPGLQLTITDRLTAEGYAVEVAGDGDMGLARGGSESFDLILLDVMLPKRDGFDVCRQLRAGGVSTPILMLTARGQTVDKVVGLRLGADDYLTKPFEAAELVARIEALLRRSRTVRPQAAGPTRYSFNDVTVDLRTAEVTRAGAPIELSAKEFQLLAYFLEHRGSVLSRDTLLHDVWGYEHTPSTRTVDMHVAWLRQKVEPNAKVPQVIVTVHGLGYKFIG